MNLCLQSMWLAWRDWKFESTLSLCAVLALASMLTPILVLQGLKNGIIQGMRARLLEDPAVLIITPKSDAGRFSPEFIADLATLPGARFAIGRTRDTATDITLVNSANDSRASIALEPAAPGEPVLERNGISAPRNGSQAEIVLSAPSAKALGVSIGATLEARLGRRSPQGRLESEIVPLKITAILPMEAADRKMAFVPLQFLEDIENYRDYLEVPERGFSGNPAQTKRQYASFRLYADNLEAVETLAQALAGKNIEVSTRAREIATIRLLERSINQIILIISLAVGAGFAAFTISSAQSAVSRKRKMLGMLRLLGFSRLSLTLYPLTQTLLTAIAGCALSLLLYLGVSFGISEAFSSQGELVCKLSPLDFGLTCLAVLILSTLSSARAARQSAAIEPSLVIREV